MSPLFEQGLGGLSPFYDGLGFTGCAVIECRAFRGDWCASANEGFTLPDCIEGMLSCTASLIHEHNLIGDCTKRCLDDARTGRPPSM